MFLRPTPRTADHDPSIVARVIFRLAVISEWETLVPVNKQLSEILEHHETRNYVTEIY